jgi:hypothetical protein
VTSSAHGCSAPRVKRKPNGDSIFRGDDPRVTWDLDYVEAYWITHCIAGELMVNLEKLRQPDMSEKEARTAVLDLIAAQTADATVKRRVQEHPFACRSRPSGALGLRQACASALARDVCAAVTQ